MDVVVCVLGVSVQDIRRSWPGVLGWLMGEYCDAHGPLLSQKFVWHAGWLGLEAIGGVSVAHTPLTPASGLERSE